MDSSSQKARGQIREKYGFRTRTTLLRKKIDGVFSRRSDEEAMTPAVLSVDSLRDDYQVVSQKFRSLLIPIAIGLLFRLAIAPFTSLEPDVAVWWQVTDNAMRGLGLYQLPGFSYPPLYGYWALTVGGMAHVLGVPVHALGGMSVRFNFLGKYNIGSIVTTPLGTLIFKIPMILSDLGTGWCVWRIVLKLGGTERQARHAFYWWYFNPLVIFVSSVHGQIDSLAALGIAAALLASLEEYWGFAGVATAFGIAAKLIPAFLIFPLVGFILGRTSGNRRRSIISFVLGGFFAGIVLFGPILGNSFVQDVFTREGADSSFGGLSLMGLLGIPGLTSTYDWVINNVVTVNRLTLIVEVIASFGIAIWVARKAEPKTLIRGSLCLFTVVLLLNPLTNPQYLDWILPLVAISACGVMGYSWLSRVAIILMSLGGIGYVLAYFGWAFLLIPASYDFKWPASKSVARGLAYLSKSLGSSWLPATPGGRFRLLCCLFVLMALILLNVQIFLRQRGIDGTDRRVKVIAEKTRFPIVVLALVALIEIFGLVAPELIATPFIAADVLHHRQSSTRILVSNPNRALIKIVVFPIAEAHRIKRILFYQSPSRPTTGSEESSVLGTYQALSADLSISQSTVKLESVDATQLANSVSDLESSRSTLIVDVSGTLPNTVWRTKGSGSLLPWIKAGGILAFAGSVPGYYSVSKGASLSGTGSSGNLAPGMVAVGGGILLPSSIVGSSDWSSPPTRFQSQWSSTLDLQYNADDFPISTSRLSKVGGTTLGMTRKGFTSEAYVPLGRGGVLVFAGPDFAAQTFFIAHDLTNLVGANWFASIGHPTVKKSNSPTIYLTASASGAKRQYAVTVFDSGRPQWLWERDLK